MSRRDWIGGAAGGTLAFGSLLGWVSCGGKRDEVPRAGAADGASRAAAVRPGLQLYTVRAPLVRDLPGTLREVAEIGYAEVELAGLHGATPEAFRAHLDAAGLRAPSAHVPLDAVRDDPDRLLAEAETLGVRDLIVPWLDEAERTVPGYLAVADTLNRAGRAAASRGVRIGYHNQAYDHEPFGGDASARSAPGAQGLRAEGASPRTGWELLLARTDPELVTMQMDVFWAVAGGADPLAYLRDHPGRFSSMHAKDRTAAGDMVDVGAGAIDYAGILRAGRAQGLERVFVEHDDPPDALASARAGYEALTSLEN